MSVDTFLPNSLFPDGSSAGPLGPMYRPWPVQIPVPPGPSIITIRQDPGWSAGATTQASGSPTLDITGVQDGDTVIHVVVCRTSAAGLGASTITDNQSYWTVDSTFADASADDNRFFFCHRVWHTGDPVTFTWNSTVACGWELGAVAYVNTLQSGPVGVNSAAEFGPNMFAHNTQSISVATPGAIVVTVAADRSASLWTQPMGYALRLNVRAGTPSQCDLAIADSGGTVASPVGPLTWTGSVTTGTGATWILELKPAVLDAEPTFHLVTQLGGYY